MDFMNASCNADGKSKKQDTIRVDSAFIIDHLHNIAISLGTVAAIFSVNLQFRTYAFISSLHRARTPELQSCNSIRLEQMPRVPLAWSVMRDD